MSTVETAAALATATEKQRVTAQRIADLQEQEQSLSDQIGRLVADGQPAKALKKQRDEVRDQLEDALYSQKHVDADAEAAQRAHADASHAEYKAQMNTLAEALKAKAQSFDAALRALPNEREQFIAAGKALRDLATRNGHAHPAAFDTALLAADVIDYHLNRNGNPVYGSAVDSLLGHIVAAVAEI